MEKTENNGKEKFVYFIVVEYTGTERIDRLKTGRNISQLVEFVCSVQKTLARRRNKILQKQNAKTNLCFVKKRREFLGKIKTKAIKYRRNLIDTKKTHHVFFF